MNTTDAAYQLAEFMQQHPRLCVLTGAGISTDSGIPDYRDKNADWKRQKPVQHADFMANLTTRQRFWARSLIGWPMMRDAKPNSAHATLVALDQAGHIENVITQNVDGLHQQAGQRCVIDLHGRSDRVICMSCHITHSRNQAHQWMAELNPEFTSLTAAIAPDGDADLEAANFDSFIVPNCPTCSGILKPDVVFFGDNVPKSRVENAQASLDNADALLVIGSSLMVYSGFRFCKRASESGKPIALLNQGLTRADPIATLKVNADISSTLQDLKGLQLNYV